MGYIYKIINTITGKLYIGQTIQPPTRRWRQHELSAFNTTRNDSNLPLHQSMRKYGTDAFRYEIIEKCDNAIINEREIYWISYYDSANAQKGYNISLGGGGTSSYNMRELLALWEQGKGIKEISEMMGIDRGFLAIRLKEEGITTEEINARRYSATKESRANRVYQYSLEGKYLGSFMSVQDARKATGIGHIENCCNGKQKQAGGYIWSYVKSDSVPQVYNDNPATRKRKVIQYDLGGNRIAEYSSAYHAEKATGINQNAIRNVCIGKSHTAGNYIWSYDNRPFLQVNLSNNTGKAKRVGKYDIKSGNLLQVYNSLTDAAKDNNISSISNISAACTGRYKKCSGFIWKFID